VATTISTVNAEKQDLTKEVSAKTNAAMAAIKRSMASARSAVKPNPSSSSTPQPRQKSSSSSTSSPKTNLNPLSKTDRSPSISSPDSPSTSVTVTKRMPSTCADDVANETKLTKTGPVLYAPPSLFASA